MHQLLGRLCTKPAELDELRKLLRWILFAARRDIVLKLHAEVTRILKDPEFIQKEITAKGYELVASTPEDFATFLAADSVRNARAVKISGAKVE